MAKRVVSQTINLQTPDQTGKYITRIDQNGITVHPENQTQNSNYIHIDGSGFKIKNQLNNSPNISTDMALAKFTIDGIQVGQLDESHLELDYHSLKLIDKEGSSYFYISDLRDKTGTAIMTEKFIGDGTTFDFEVALHLASYKQTDLSVTVDDVAVSYQTHQSSSGSTAKTFTLATAPTAGSIVKIIYPTKYQDAKAYTLGQRKSGEIIGARSYSEGFDNVSSGYLSHAEGRETNAINWYTHAEGWKTTASGSRSHAEGQQTEASGYASHAEGDNTVASDNFSHAEGSHSTASAQSAHAEGGNTIASGGSAHAEGLGSVASGSRSHAQNYRTIASKVAQTALGTYNVEDTSTSTMHPNADADYGQYALIIGNGTSNAARSNALAVDWKGRVNCGDYSGAFKSLFDIFYPVGSFYETSDANFNPSTIWGGTWSLVASKDAYIVDEGTDGIWTYRKWSDGIAECWGTTSVPSSTYSANGGYKSVSETLPSGLFNAYPTMVLASGRITSVVHTSMGFTTYDNASRIQTYLINRGTSSVTKEGQVYWKVKGTWSSSVVKNFYRWHRTA